MQCVWHSIQEGGEKGDGGGCYGQWSSGDESAVLRQRVPVHGRPRRGGSFGKWGSVYVVAFQRHGPARPGS